MNRNQTTRISNKAPKTKRWTVRLIDTIAAFLAINARTSFSIQNDAEIKSYSQLDFYRDLLKEKYPTSQLFPKFQLSQEKQTSTNRNDVIGQNLVIVEIKQKPPV